MAQQQEASVKLVNVGDGSVGKTCILMSYTENKFPEKYVPTILETKSCEVNINGRTVNLGLWDTAGQEQYEQLRGLAYTETDVFLIVFSVVDPASFDNALKKWYPEIQENVPQAAKVFVGNKIDMRAEYSNKQGKDAPIMKETAQQIISNLGCKYVECSALTQEGLKEVFQVSVTEGLNKKDTDSSSKSKKKKKDKKKGCTLI
ncbi:P-loop containing nucleoside triphosphate hydrolase [Pseudocohnilembus persalinus]|uniref:p-loop containing nucleoside triphosphate hydrolase n=1 Tax=Pseudocohnilembus persalinus TaxID=266149 RepID=A0A0V0QRG5_PSEPJ|nr:P-loop containing nucleoside triphosphate hydrolase [Pseudocohnilembus persalinus]|eukprot:KRX04868.1 P-loop containing nucleoside triphosphate hydrolase [Pseudocohnilembus persalinus]